MPDGAHDDLERPGRRRDRRPQPSRCPQAARRWTSSTASGARTTTSGCARRATPRCAAYLEAENAYADAVMKPTEAFQGALYKEMLGRIKETDLTVPYREGGYFYYSRTEEGKQYPILCRKKGSLEAPEEVMLDLNELAEGQPFMSPRRLRGERRRQPASPTRPTTPASAQYTLYVKDLAPASSWPQRCEKAGSVAWAADNRTLFYTVEDERQAALPPLPPPPRRAEPDDARLRGDGRALPRRRRPHAQPRVPASWASGSHTTTEARVPARRRARRRRGAWWPRASHEHEYDVDHHGDRFYIRTNDTRPQLPPGDGAGRRARAARAGRRSCPTART